MNAANGDASSGSGLAGVNEADTYGMSPNGAASPPPTDPNQGHLKTGDQGKLAEDGLDAPALKKEMAGTGGDRHNISVDTATGDFYLSPARKGSGNPLVDIGYKYNQLAGAFRLK